MNKATQTKRIVVILAIAAAAVVTSSLAGAAPSGPTTAPVRYAPSSSYVFASSGERMGVLTGDGLDTQFVTSSGQRAS